MGLVAAPSEHLDLLSELALVHGEVVPDVGVARHDAHQHPLAGAADQDRGAAYRLRLAHDLVHREVLSAKGDLLLRPHALQDLRGLVEGAHAFAQAREGAAIALEFGLEPARTETDDGSSVRNVVDGRDLLGENRRVPKEGRSDQCAELYVLGDGRHGRQLGPRLEDREARQGNSVEVIADPDRVVAEAVEFHSSVAGLLPASLDLRKCHAESGGRRHEFLQGAIVYPAFAGLLAVASQQPAQRFRRQRPIGRHPLPA